MNDLFSLIRNVWIAVMLTAGSISDIRYKNVSAGYLITALIVSIAVSIPGFEASRSIPGLLPGLFVLLVARISPSSVGEADAWALCFTGMVLGLYAAACILMIALFATALCAQILIVMKKAGRADSIPLYPFLTLGHILRLILI